jgi:hypothetical protein
MCGVTKPTINNIAVIFSKTTESIFTIVQTTNEGNCLKKGIDPDNFFFIGAPILWQLSNPVNFFGRGFDHWTLKVLDFLNRIGGNTKLRIVMFFTLGSQI